ncbi:MAG: tetratricopeptide repeat protein [Anaerolineales bacterium]|nr:tetratricopeptide repeat protein [Anaerolineales bacterium]MCX7609065.1 tetratricopeptide repeat protein [Anaerolineales bacterium]MDW8227994.1 tetratricopeptide repeat protein [Anaerolineales bacterium]
MTDEDLFPPEESGENIMLREAIQAIRAGDRTRARDLLTRLLKADPNNASYWVWLSGVVDTQKERLYCLQTALKLDPQNTAARRGLLILGGREAEPGSPPFPLNRPRSWEEKIVLPKPDVERPRGLANPFVRIVLALLILALAGGLFLGGRILNRANIFRPAIVLRTATPRPTFTISPTPTNTPLFRTPTPTFLGPTPLAYFLAATYTPTPLYVVTEHPILTRDSFQAGLRFLASGQYDIARVQFELVLQSEPQAVDALYYIGESYRFEGKYQNARDAYQKAIEINPNFAPAFLGRARANLALNPDTDVLADLDTAIALDPVFAEAYLERGAYLLRRDDPRAAADDLQTALELMPYSAPAWRYLAEAQLRLGQPEQALQSALRANQLDMTLVPGYLTLAKAYIATGQIEQASAVLQTYTIYEPNDVSAFLLVGTAYNSAGKSEQALQVLTRYLEAYPRNAEAYYQRGLARLNLQNYNLAEQDFQKALRYDPNDFDAQIGLARAYYGQGRPGDAYVQVNNNALPLAKSDQTKAQCYYWQAIFLEAVPNLESSREYWRRLLALPADAMPAEWRQQAFEKLGITPTATKTLTPTKTPTKSP